MGEKGGGQEKQPRFVIGQPPEKPGWWAGGKAKREWEEKMRAYKQFVGDENAKFRAGLSEYDQRRQREIEEQNRRVEASRHKDEPVRRMTEREAWDLVKAGHDWKTVKLHWDASHWNIKLGKADEEFPWKIRHWVEKRMISKAVEVADRELKQIGTEAERRVRARKAGEKNGWPW